MWLTARSSRTSSASPSSLTVTVARPTSALVALSPARSLAASFEPTLAGRGGHLRVASFLRGAWGCAELLAFCASRCERPLVVVYTRPRVVYAIQILILLPQPVYLRLFTSQFREDPRVVYTTRKGVYTMRAVVRTMSFLLHLCGSCVDFHDSLKLHDIYHYINQGSLAGENHDLVKLMQVRRSSQGERRLFREVSCKHAFVQSAA